MIKIQIKGYDNLEIVVETVEEATEFIRLFNAPDTADITQMSHPKAAITYLKQSGQELSISQLADILLRMGLKSYGKRDTCCQNISHGLKRELKRPNSRVENIDGRWRYKSSEVLKDRSKE